MRLPLTLLWLGWGLLSVTDACVPMQEAVSPTTAPLTTAAPTTSQLGPAATSAGGAQTPASGGATTVTPSSAGPATAAGATTAAASGGPTAATGGGATTTTLAGGGATTTSTIATTTTTTGVPCTGFAVSSGPAVPDTADGGTFDLDCGAAKALSGCPTCPTAAPVTFVCNAGTWMDGATALPASPGLTCTPTCTSLTVTNGDPIPELPNGETYDYSCPAGMALINCNTCPIAPGASLSLACSEPNWLDGGSSMSGALECATPCVVQADTETSIASIFQGLSPGLSSAAECCQACADEMGTCASYLFTTAGSSCARFTNVEDPSTLRAAPGNEYGTYGGACACI